MDCKSEERKYDILVSLYYIGKSIIFRQQWHTADREAYDRRGATGRFASCVKEGNKRDLIIDDSRDGLEKVLITTNAISRGINVLQVNIVMNYDLPIINDREGAGGSGGPRPDIETYIHRIGTWLFPG